MVECLAIGTGVAPTLAGQEPADAAVAAKFHTPADLSLGFVENRGQWVDPIRYSIRAPGISAQLRDDGVAWMLHSRDARPRDPRDRAAAPATTPLAAPLAMTFAGAALPLRLEPEDRQEAYANFFIGNDRSRWASHVPTFASVRYREVLPGIDVRFHRQHRAIEYDVLLAPGARLADLQIRIHGARGLRLDARGDLLIDTPAGVLRQSIPAGFADTPDGARRDIACRHVLIDQERIGFAVDGLLAGEALVIDPQVVPHTLLADYFSYLGGSDGDTVTDVVLRDGVATMTGTTRVDPAGGIPFPSTPGVYGTLNNGPEFDTFVTRVNALGTAIQWSTFVGAANIAAVLDQESGYGIDVDESQGVWVCGATTNIFSGNFPLTPGAAQTTVNNSNGDTDGFVYRLSPNGANLVYSTLVAGWNQDFAFDIKVDAQQRAYVTGFTNSATLNDVTLDFLGMSNLGAVAEPTSLVVVNAGFAVRINSTGTQFLDATFIRTVPNPNPLNSTSVIGTAIAILPDPSDSTKTITYVTGEVDVDTTTGQGMAITANAFQPVYGGNKDAFLVALNDGFAAYTYVSYLGGSEYDIGRGIDVAATGIVAIAGSTTEPLAGAVFPTKNAFQIAHGGSTDAFLTRFEPTQSTASNTVLSSSFLGGNGDDHGHDVWLNSLGRIAYVTGRTDSFNLPTAGPLLPYQNMVDAFLIKAQNNVLLFSTHLGGVGDDEALALDVEDGFIVLAGRTTSPNFYSLIDGLNPLAGLASFQSTIVGAMAFPVGSVPPVDLPLLDFWTIKQGQDGFVLRLEEQ